jgi:hypothetical protein
LTLELLEDRRLPSTAVLTYHNDLARTGENLTETSLTPATVNANTFGQQYSYPVDGQIYAQPLYFPGLTLADGSTHNVVFVATEHDSVYAFDANGGGLLWQTSFIDPANGITSVPAVELGSVSITPEVGITGTPVIDNSTDTLYVVAKTKEVRADGIHYVQRLHALDITSGQETGGGSFTIGDTMFRNRNENDLSVPGTGIGSVNGVVTFNARTQLQRTGLVLTGGLVYAAWASAGDKDPYHGWLVGFDAHTLQPVQVFNDSANDAEGGIWMSGGAPAVDANGHMFLVTGNGAFNPDQGSYGESVLNLSTAGQPAVQDFFTPHNWDALNQDDIDLGSSGVILLPDQPGPHPHLMVAGGKEGKIYLLDRDNLGQVHTDFDNVVQILPGSQVLFDNPAYFDAGAPESRWVYFAAIGRTLQAYQLTNGLLSAAPTSQSSTAFGYPGATPSISANGTANGIVWVLELRGDDPGVLHAYDALNLGNELYNSEQVAARDEFGPGTKFAIPTIADGKVFVGGATNLAIFGLLGPGTSIQAIAAVLTGSVAGVATPWTAPAILPLSAPLGPGREAAIAEPVPVAPASPFSLAADLPLPFLGAALPHSMHGVDPAFLGNRDPLANGFEAC